MSFLSRFAFTIRFNKPKLKHKQSLILLVQQHYSRSITISTHQQHYINQLTQSLINQQLTPAAVDQILNHLHSNQLFPHLPTTTYDSLLDFNPAIQLDNTLSSNYYLYNRIFFLLDRIHERKHLFSKNHLNRFHSIALKRLAHAGLFKPAELIWEQLINQSSPHHPHNQILMLHCIRTAINNHHDSHLITQQHQNQFQNQNQELLPLSPRDLKRMISLTDLIATNLMSSSFTGTTMDQKTERWAVRTVAEIYALQGERKRLTEWLTQRRALDLDFPDNGACWSDPKLTALVVRMFKEQGRLDKMISIYEAALHPSPSMLTHPESCYRTIFESSSPSPIADPQPVVSRQRGGGSRDRSYPILTRTYHDLISACVHANRPHLAIHYLTVAVEDNEAYVERLPEVPLDLPSVPHLRLQPATYAELVPSLVRKKRDTQLKTVYDLTERLVQSTVRELQWIRLLATSRSTCENPDDDNKRHPWHLVLAAIVPELTSGQPADMETAKAENLSLEKAVFTHHNQPSSIDPLHLPLITSSIDEEDNNTPALESGHMKDELGFLRTLERAKFLSRSLAHSLRLLQRLHLLIHKTRLNRDIRFQHTLLKKSKSNSSPGASAPFLSAPSSSTSTAVPAPQLRTLSRINALLEQKKSLRFGRS
ncbi:hypothetical protein VP01_984g1 [Puccinia sorghi]|uniref:Uncharacterized protein n=1 Tax=Puccinia sorghi TaxID=27349 RepID=A0A0L6U641_9BASI|nr:hypothetical protein VP01_984g1 [Puccinia sorghi]